MIFKNLAKSKAGSTLIWVLIMMLVLGILITSGLLIAQSYSNQSLNKHTETQAYYTALSSTKAIAEWLDGTSEKEPTGKDKQLRYLSEIRKAENSSVTFDTTVDSSLGDCSTTISINPNNSDITITSTAKYIDSEATVSCLLSNGQSSTAGASPSTVKVLTIPDDSKIAIATNEQTATDDNDKKNLINREMDLNFNNSDSYIIQNRLSPYSLTKYANQYYKMNMSGGNNRNNIYVGLQNGDITNDVPNTGGFLATDNDNNIQDRSMVVYAGDAKMNAKYNSLTIYSDEGSNPPRKDITLAPNFDTTIAGKNLDIGFKKHNNIVLNNTHVQINDTGVDPQTGERSVFNLMNGINFTGDSSIFTRRDMFIGSAAGTNPMALDMDSKTGTTNKNTFSRPTAAEEGAEAYLNAVSNTLEGKLIIAGGITTVDPYGTYWHINEDGTKTREDRSFILRGDMIIGGTPGELAEFNMATAVELRGGNIFVKDGGTLNLNVWNCANYNTVFVEPGGTVNIGGTKKYAPIYVLPGRNKDGKGGKVIVSYGGEFHSKVMETLEGEEILGTVYLGGDGAEIEHVGSSFAGSQNGVHAEEGSIIDDEFADSRLVCQVMGTKGKPVNQADFKTNVKCEHGIKVPLYGNTVEAWVIKGYYEN